MQEEKIRVAVLDMNDGHPNQGMRSILALLKRYREENNLELTYDIFDVRQKCEVPETDFDIYISSGGPGNPIESIGSEWDNRFCKLIEELDAHNKSERPDKKYAFFICHSFQLMCRHYKLGKVCIRCSPSFGIFPTHKTAAAFSEEVFEGLPDPFYVVDSRKWQVISPDFDRIEATGATILALEKERPHVPLERCIMAMRFNEYFFGTQFHPEADPEGMLTLLNTEEKKKEVIDEHGEEKYDSMIEQLEDPDKIKLTQSLMIPSFLTLAIEAKFGVRV